VADREASGSNKGIIRRIFDLSDLSDRGAPGIELPSLRTLGEILSGRMIQGGGSVNLTSAEWLQRWQPSARSILNGINWVGRESE
jgi:hypothetical protein